MFKLDLGSFLTVCRNFPSTICLSMLLLRMDVAFELFHFKDLFRWSDILQTFNLWYVVMLDHGPIPRHHFDKVGLHFELNCVHETKLHVILLRQHNFWSTLHPISIH